jgi:hypothetical protein
MLFDYLPVKDVFLTGSELNLKDHEVWRTSDRMERWAMPRSDRSENCSVGNG